MQEVYSIFIHDSKQSTSNLKSPVFSVLEPAEKKYEMIYNNSAFWVAGNKKDCEENIFEDENELIILIGYILHDEIDYKLNIAKQILDLYKLQGLDLIKEISGAFNVIIFEKEKQKLTITNDRLGMKPLYYYSDKDKFIFASDIKTIALSNQIKKEINWRAWGDIFNYGFIVGNETPFENILSLPMSSILTYEKGNLEIKEYWSFNLVKIDYKPSEKETIEKGVEILKKITKKYDKFIKYAELPLSGGYDSRCIACCFKYYSKIEFDTITSNLHAKGKEDIIIAKELAKALNLKNTQVSDNNLYKKYFIEMVYLVNGMTFEHLWAMSLRNNLKNDIPTFDGIAADVLLPSRVFGILSQDANKEECNDNDIINVFINSKKLSSSKALDAFNEKAKKQMAIEADVFLKQIKDTSEIKHKLTFLFLNNRIRNSNSVGSHNIIGKDKKAYFFFLDNDFLEFCLAMPAKYKKNIYRKILKLAFPEIMLIPTTNDLPFLSGFKNKIFHYLNNFLADSKSIKIFNLAGINFNKSKKLKIHSKFSAFSLNKEEEKYLLSLIKKLDFPSELNKDLLFEQVEKEILKGEKIDHILIPIANFLVWYNLFYLEKSLDYLKSI